MKFDDILKTYGKTQDKRILLKLSSLCNTLFDDDKWKFTDTYDSETGTSDFGDRYYVTIGNRALTDSCNDSEYNKAAYVLAVKDIYHEQRHVWHGTRAWNDRTGLNSLKSYRQTTDIVRREFLKKYFPSVYYNNYSNDPGEMDAERYGIEMALTYFKSDPIISKPEAEEIMYELMMSDDCVHRKILKPEKDRLKSVYDILNLFKERTETAASIKYQITMEISSDFENELDIDLSMTHEFLYSGKFKEYRKAFNSCKTGTEQDKVLEQAVLFAYPDIIRKTPLRLRRELLDCKRQMESGFFRSGLHAIPPKRINYSIQTVSKTEEPELTDEDLASIHVTDNNINL